MDELKQSIKELSHDVKDIKEVVIRNTASLEEHMRRTELNEKRIESLEKWTLGFLTTIVLGLIAKLFYK